MKLKLCGFKKLEDINKAFELGVDFIGLNNIKSSKRYLAKEELLELFKGVEQRDKIVLLIDSYDEDFILQLKELGLVYIQTYFDESYDKKLLALAFKLIKVIRVSVEEDLKALSKLDAYPFELILLDSKSKTSLGGSGETFDWELYDKAHIYSGHALGLAGGLNPSNLAQALKITKTCFVDLASGAEDDQGNKDFKKINKFLEIIKDYQSHLQDCNLFE